MATLNYEKLLEENLTENDFAIISRSKKDFVDWIKSYNYMKEQNLLLKPKYIVGDTLYMPHRGEVIPFKIYSVTIYENRTELRIYYAGNDSNLEFWNITLQEKDIGYEVFYTQKEAENALNEIN